MIITIKNKRIKKKKRKTSSPSPPPHHATEKLVIVVRPRGPGASFPGVRGREFSFNCWPAVFTRTFSIGWFPTGRLETYTASPCLPPFSKTPKLRRCLKPYYIIVGIVCRQTHIHGRKQILHESSGKQCTWKCAPGGKG